MKIITALCLMILLMAPVFAQNEQAGGARDANRLIENADWSVSDRQGLILKVSGDSLNFKERWLHIIDGVTVLSTKENAALPLEDLEAPCWVEISFFRKGKTAYVTSLRHLIQLAYDREGTVVGEIPDQPVE